MAGRTVTQEDIRAAAKAYCEATGLQCSIGEDDHKIRFFKDTPGDGDQVVWEEAGQLKTNNPEFGLEFREYLPEPARAPRAEARQERTNVPATQRSGQARQMMPHGKGLDALTTADIISYINPKATEADAWLFLRFCQEKGLNPITKEAYLVIYDSKDGKQVSIITGKEAFTKKAEAHGQFDGFRAGIVVRNEAGELEFDREGTFLLPKEELLGGWAEVCRKDRRTPFKAQVALKEYNTGRKMWTTMPATMIRKVALVQALREAFPADLGGCYDRTEMDQAIDAEYEVGA